MNPNVPVPLTSFIGRQRELNALHSLLAAARLVTLTGVGGCGKTRLAIQIAATTNGAFPAGAWFVDLAPLRDPALIPQLVLEILGLHPAPGLPVIDTLLDFLRPRRMLLILDNCEHLTPACAGLAQQLLTHAPHVRILATSREPLAVMGEHIYPLSGLSVSAPHHREEYGSLPLTGQNSSSSGQANRTARPRFPPPADREAPDALRLFVERAQTIAPDFTLTAENSPAVAEICRRLDGLPLAIELASARTRLLSVQEIAARLDDHQPGRLDLLATSPRLGLDARHHNLRSVIDWSYVLLPEAERRLLRRLAVFTGGFSLEGVQAVCLENPRAAGRAADPPTLDLLGSLVDKSLLLAETAGRDRARYRLLETIREYAFEKLDQAGETARFRDHHLAFLLACAEDISPRLNAAGQQRWLDWLESEHDNLRAAMAWALESGQIEPGLRIANAILCFWEIRGYVQEAWTWMQRFIPRMDEQVSLLVRITTLTFTSFLAMFQGDAPAATAYAHQAVALAENYPNQNDPMVITALSSLDSGARVAGDFPTAFAILERMNQRMREASGHSFFLSMGLLTQADTAVWLGAYETAHVLLEESLALARQDGDAFRMAHAHHILGDLALCEGNPVEAQRQCETSVALLREIGATHDLASMIRNLGNVCLLRGDMSRAHALFCESLAAHEAEHHVLAMAECLIGLGAVAVEAGFPTAGVRLLAAAITVRGPRPVYVWPVKPMEAEGYLEQARHRLPEQTFQAELAAGQALSLEQAIQIARGLSIHSHHSTQPKSDGLTEREREVAALITAGKTNQEIAEELVLSKRTVEKHVANILLKLGLDRRTQIVRWAMEHQ